MQSFDRFRTSYEADLGRALRGSGQDADFFTRAKARALLELTHRHLGDPGVLDVLDVGCGIGSTDTELLPVFRGVTGVDLSEALLERAAERNPDARYDSYSGGRLPYDDGAFEVVFAFCVLHHVPPRERPLLVGEMRRVTRAGGLVVIGEHNPLNPLTRLVVSRCAFDDDALLLSAREAERLMRGAGLGRLERRHILVLPSERRVARAIDAWLGALPIGAQYVVAGRPSPA